MLLKESRKSPALIDAIPDVCLSKTSSIVTNGAIIREENEHSLRLFQTIIHVMKGNIGTGMLALPRAISLAGLWTGSIGLVFICVFCIQCMHLIVECAQRLCIRLGKSYMSYADVAEFAFSTSSNKALHKYSRFARTSVDVMLCFTQVGICCAYLVFIPQNIFEVLIANDSCLEYYSLMAIALIPILIVMSVRNLDWLAPFSFISIIMLVYGLIIICYYAFQDLPPISTVPAFGSWSGIPIWFATTMFSFTGIGVVLPLENQMKEPKKMVSNFGTINISMALCAFMYLIMGFFGYWRWLGEEIEGSITLNLPQFDWEAQSTKLVMACAVFLTYPLQMYPVVEVFLPGLQKRFAAKFSVVVELGLRYILVAITFALAAAVPKIDLFISLTGAVATSTLALIAPAIIHTTVFWKEFEGTSGKLKLARNIFLLILGILGMVVATVLSVKDIVEFFVNPPSEGNVLQCNNTTLLKL